MDEASFQEYSAKLKKIKKDDNSANNQELQNLKVDLERQIQEAKDQTYTKDQTYNKEEIDRMKTLLQETVNKMNELHPPKDDDIVG